MKPPLRIEIPGVELVRRLGSGSSAFVWLARGEGREYFAVKVFFAPTDLGKAFDEAGVLARINHPNIIRIHTVHRGSNYVAIVMDLAPSTLEHYVRRSGPLRGAQVVGLITDLCAGVGALHDCDLAHGDISPNNIAFKWDGSAQLLDFGASRDDLTLGTPGFSLLAPTAEQNTKKRQRSADTDLEQRMRRLLGGTTKEARGVGIWHKQRRDLLGICQVGLFALGRHQSQPDVQVSSLGNQAGSHMGGVAEEIAQRLCKQIEIAIQLAEGEAIRPDLLAHVISEVIPRAPISVTGLEFDAEHAHGGKTERAQLPALRTEKSKEHAALNTADRTVAPERLRVEKQRSKRSALRPILATLALISGLCIIGVGVFLPETPELETHQVETKKDQTRELAHWQKVVDELGARRDVALQTSQIAQLELVNVSGSPAEVADFDLVESLATAQIRVDSFQTESRVREVREVGAERVLLVVQTRVRKQEIRTADGNREVSLETTQHEQTQSGASHSARGAGQQVVLELKKVAGEWLIYSVSAL